MAIKLVGNYAKRLGLPGYSSHQFSVSIETELTDLGQVQGEAQRVYELLQNAVDREIQETGFVPGDEYGLTQPNIPQRLNGNGNGSTTGNGNGHWSCSEKQKEFIQKLIRENELDPQAVEDTAYERFGTGLRQLNKLQASGLIAELLESCNGSKRGKNGTPAKGGRR